METDGNRAVSAPIKGGGQKLGISKVLVATCCPLVNVQRLAMGLAKLVYNSNNYGLWYL